MTAPGTPGPPGQRATLSRELGDFLVEFSIALHKHSMYPQGHPSLGPAAGAVVTRAAMLFDERGSLSLGVARHQLIIEGVATDPKHPVLGELAGRLHRHHLGAISFQRGLDAPELADVLKTLAVDAERSGQALGLKPAGQLPAWPHVRLHPLTYDRLQLLEDRGEPGADMGGGGRAAQLWVGLARAALAQDAAAEPATMEPAAIAHAIEEHTEGEAYDQVIVGYLLQIAEELKAAGGGADSAALRRRTSKLISALRPDTVRRLVEMGGDAGQRRKFVLDATSGMAVDAVLELVKAAADTSHQTISHGLVRMLSKMAVHAEQGGAVVRPQADAALREQVQNLIAGWSIADPTPDAYGKALQQMSKANPLFAAPRETSHAAEPLRLVQMSLEVDTAGPLVWRAVAAVVEQGRLADLLGLLDQPNGAGVAAAILELVATPETLRQVLAADPVDWAVVDRLTPRLGAAAADPMLDSLAGAEGSATRRALLERLPRIGSALGPLILPRLADSRWFVVRNLLDLLDQLPELPAGFSAAQFRSHDDARVRQPAIKLQLKVPAERATALRFALTDQDERVLRLGLATIRQDCPAAAVPVVVGLLWGRELPVEVRTLAIRALGSSKLPEARDALLRLVIVGKTWWGKPKLARKSPELLAAVRALARRWSADPKARAALAVAAASADPEIRNATEPPRESVA